MQIYNTFIFEAVRDVLGINVLEEALRDTKEELDAVYIDTIEAARHVPRMDTLEKAFFARQTELSKEYVKKQAKLVAELGS